MRTPSQRQVSLLTKFLGLTGSSQDGEALNAMRMAQKLLRELDATWEDVVAGRMAAVSVGGVQVAYHRPTYNPPKPPPRPSRPAYPPPPQWGDRPDREYQSGNDVHYTFSASRERYTDSDINLIFEPMHTFPFRFEDKASLDGLWRTFLKTRKLNTVEFAELIRLQKECARGINPMTGRAWA